MKWKGGYSFKLHGRPSKEVKVLPEAEELYLPLSSRRFRFTTTCVKDGQDVAQGSVLAMDPSNYYVPLISPRKGTASVNTVSGHIVIRNLQSDSAGQQEQDTEFPHIPRNIDSRGKIRYKLLKLGAWQFFEDAFTGKLPDPLSSPQAVIVSTMQLTPFLARGDVLIKDRLRNFTRGLEHLQSLLEYQPIHLVIPSVQSTFAHEIRELVRGYAWIKPFEAPLKYPYDNYTLLARKIGLKPKTDECVWALHAEGVLAIDDVLTGSKPVCDRVISIGGPAADAPVHVRLTPGYPYDALFKNIAIAPSSRIINGGIFTGSLIDGSVKGIDSECAGLTILSARVKREFLAFVWPGFKRDSLTKCFAGSIIPGRVHRPTAAVNGEIRACVGCGFCADICPAGIYPSAIHKSLYQGSIELAERFRIDLCIQCGLCTYVCPSKIEHGKELGNAIETIRRELQLEKCGGCS